jgi:hypothetical protein
VSKSEGVNRSVLGYYVLSRSSSPLLKEFNRPDTSPHCLRGTRYKSKRRSESIRVTPQRT